MYKYFSSLNDALVVKWTGTELVSTDGHARSLRCVKKLNGIRIYVDKVWNGNGFGYSRTYYIVDTVMGIVKVTRDDYTWIVRNLSD